MADAEIERTFDIVRRAAVLRDRFSDHLLPTLLQLPAHVLPGQRRISALKKALQDIYGCGKTLFLVIFWRHRDGDSMKSSKKTVSVVGAGLAGSECALQLASMGWKVVLFEMRDQHLTPAHKTSDCAELVCSNSLGSETDYSAPGQLKWEAEKLNSFVLTAGRAARVPAGMALGVDREVFSRTISEQISASEHIEVRRERVLSIDDLPRPAIIATGPLTDEPLALSLKQHLGEQFLFFFDAIAPIIDTDSIDMNIAWKADRWGKGSNDYINCPLSRQQYHDLIREIKNARKIEPKEFETTPYFEGCMPVEEFVARGDETLRFGPASPKGLPNPHSEERPYAVIQLRQENREATSYGMVGFQTRMAWSEQKRVFRGIPGLEEAEFLKLGSVHRNLYINSTKKLNADLSSKTDPDLFFAGQITGVEGYFESACIGLLVAQFIDQKYSDKSFHPPPRGSAMGSLLYALTGEEKEEFQPTNINFGLLPEIAPDGRKKIPKREKRDMKIALAKEVFQRWLSTSEADV